MRTLMRRAVPAMLLALTTASLAALLTWSSLRGEHDVDVDDSPMENAVQVTTGISANNLHCQTMTTLARQKPA